MIRTKVRSKFKKVKFDLTDLFIKAGQTVAFDIKHGIDSGIDIEGNPFPSLENATVNRKGHEQPLIDTNKLRRGIRVKKIKMNHVRVYIDDERAKIGYYLQEEGIKTKEGKLKHFNFFGISKDTSTKIWAMVKAEIKKQIRKGKMK